MEGSCPPDREYPHSSRTLSQVSSSEAYKQRVMWRCRDSHGGLIISPNWIVKGFPLSPLLPMRRNGHCIFIQKEHKTINTCLCTFLWSIHLSHKQNRVCPQSLIYLLLTSWIPTRPSKSNSARIFRFGGDQWLWLSFLELSKFHDKSEGYLLEDTCLIEAVFDISRAPTFNDSNSHVTIDPLKLGYIEAQSFLESLSKAPSRSASNSPTCERPLFNGHATFAKEIFDKLISYHLDDLAEPKNESAMMDFISTLANNVSLFNEVQAREIINLKATFPQIIQEWRVLSKTNGTNELPHSTFQKTISVLQDLVEKEVGIRTKLEELSKKETELEAKLEAIECKSLMPKEERDRVSKQMKTVCCLVEERASEIKARGLEVDSANQKLEHRLKSQWAAMRHLFA